MQFPTISEPLTDMLRTQVQETNKTCKAAEANASRQKVFATEAHEQRKAAEDDAGRERMR